MEFGTEMLDEDGLFDLVHRLPGKKSKYQIAAENEHSKVGSACWVSAVLAGFMLSRS